MLRVAYRKSASRADLKKENRRLMAEIAAKLIDGAYYRNKRKNNNNENLRNPQKLADRPTGGAAGNR